MVLLLRRLVASAVVAGMLLLAGCGAGLITGLASSSNGGTNAETRVPAVTVDSTTLPLFPAPDLVREVVVTDATLANVGQLVVELSALGESVSQPITSVTPQGDLTTISYRVDTSKMRPLVPASFQSDVPGTLSVLADGVTVGDPVPVELARQPRATLDPNNGMTDEFLSPLGERVSLLVDGLRSNDVQDLEVLISTRDPESGGEMVTRRASGLELEQLPDGRAELSATLPGSAHAVRAEIEVRDVLAGQSTAVVAFYRPEIAIALPAQGPSTGGTVVTLIGAALAPYEFGSATPTVDFDRVTITFAKGGRVVELPRVDFRTQESETDRLVFSMPSSPDGRPGSVDIVIRVELDGAVAVVTASREYLFANPDPYYGPRGAVLEQAPVAARPIQLDNAPSTDDAHDFAILTEQGGVGFLQLLLALQNGMFQPFAAPRRLGNHELGEERNPRDLLIGDFDGDGIPDMLVVNEGSATASHLLVLGQARPDPPFGKVFRIPAPGGSYRGAVGDFDHDGLPDVLLVPGPNAALQQKPHVMLSRPVGVGEPAFAREIDVAVRDFSYEAFEVADLDGDGILDLAFASGSEMSLDALFGNGDGTFGELASEQLFVPGYTADAQSPAVGLHACHDGKLQSLCLVLAGIKNAAATRTTILVVPQPAPRKYDSTGEFYSPPFEESIAVSIATDLDQSDPGAGGPIELVVGFADGPVSYGLLQLNATNPAGPVFDPLYAQIEGGTTGGVETPLEIRSMSFATAFPASENADEAKAVFVVHEVEVDGERERRLSTRLVAEPSPNAIELAPPDANGRLPFAIEGIVAGSFSETSVLSQGGVRDLALASKSGLLGNPEITVVENDGFGGFPVLGTTLEFPLLLPKSLALKPNPGTYEGLVFAGSDSRLGSWLHSVDELTESPRLRDLLLPPLSGLDLDDDTRIVVADIDGDGHLDMVVLMSFQLQLPTEGDSMLALLRGKPDPVPGEFPFEFPTQLTPVHGNASSLAVGDFIGQPRNPTGSLQVVVAVPGGTLPSSVDGNHLRFYRYVPGSTPREDRLAFSATANGPEALLAGSAPTQVVASDFDRDNRTDLLIACRGDNTLRLFRNTAQPGVTGAEVNVGAFVEALSSPVALAPGMPTSLRLADVNGDSNLDAVVFVEFVDSMSVRTSTVATYLSSGVGEFGDARFASATRIGNRDGSNVADIGDWNRDGVPDLFIGWDEFTTTGNEVNLRVLFGATR